MKRLSLILFVCLITVAKATQLNETEPDKTELQIQMDLLKNTINKLSLESENIQQNIRKTQQDLENEIQSLEQTKESLAQKEDELAKSQRYVETLLEEIGAKTEQLEILEETNSDLENKLAQVKRERTFAIEQLAEERNNTARLEANIEETRKSLRLSREALETASQEIESAYRDLEERRATIRNLGNVVHEKETTIQQLSARRDELENNVKELQQTEASLRTELEDSKKELDQLKNTCSKACSSSEKETGVSSADALVEETKQVAYEYLTISSPNKEGIFILGPLEEHLRIELQLDEQGKLPYSSPEFVKMVNGEFLQVLNTLGSAGWKVISANTGSGWLNWYVLERPQGKRQTNATLEPLVAVPKKKDDSALSGNELLEKAILQFELDKYKALQEEYNRTQQAKVEELERRFRENEKNLNEAVQIIRNSFMEQANTGNKQFVSPFFFPSLEQLVQAIKKDRDDRMNQTRQVVPLHGTEPFEEIKDAVITQLEKEKERLRLVFLDELRPYEDVLIHHLKKFHGLDVGLFSSSKRNYGQYGYLNLTPMCLLVKKDWKEPTFVQHGIDDNCETSEHSYYANPVDLLGVRFFWTPPRK